MNNKQLKTVKHILNMVRNYIRKSNRAQKYSKENLEEAIRRVQAREITIYRAVLIYNIPKTTLFNRLKGNRGQKSKSFGRSTAIPYQQEIELANHIKIMEKWGFGLTRKEVLEVVSEFVKTNNIKTPFADGCPGEDWFIQFKRRHRLSLKKPQAVEIARKNASDPFLINEYFDILQTVLSENDLHDKPKQIFNLDETYFCLDPSKLKVLGAINAPATRTTSGPGKENITVLIAASASGLKLPPMIIFKGKYLWDTWVASEDQSFPGLVYASSQKGWMESDIFYNYLKNSFVRHIGGSRPVLLIYDGHATDIDTRSLKFALENQIIILKLPPHTSHLLQPLDLSVFKSMKNDWETKLVSWQRKHIGQKVSKQTFSIFVS